MCQISQICQLYKVLLVIKQVKMGILTVRLYAGTDAGGSTFLPSPALPSRPVPSPTHFLHLEVGPPYTPWRSGGNNVCYTVGSGAEPWLKTNVVHSRAVRKPLVAIILSILKCMFYSRTITI